MTWTETHTNLVIALATLLLGYAGWFVQRRAQKTTERAESRQADVSAFAGMKDLASILQAERDRVDALLAEERKRSAQNADDLRATRNDLDQLRHDFRDVQTTLRTAISYIRDLLAAWAAMIQTPPPPIPDALSHHVAPRNVTDLFDTQDPK